MRMVPGCGGWASFFEVPGLPEEVIVYVRAVPFQTELRPWTARGSLGHESALREAIDKAEQGSDPRRFFDAFTSGLVQSREEFDQLLERAAADRWVIAEVYVDGNGRSIGPSEWKRIPWAKFEQEVAAERDQLAIYLYAPAPDLATLATFNLWALVASQDSEVFRLLTGDEDPTENAFVNTMLEQLAGGPTTGAVRPASYPARFPVGETLGRMVPEELDEFEGPGPDGVSRSFLERVTVAYEAAVARGSRRPSQELAEKANVSPRTVQAWVRSARLAGIMPPGRRGTAGFFPNEEESK